MKPFRNLVLPCMLAASALALACKSLGTPEDQERAASLQAAISGHEQWGSFLDYEGWQKGRSPHGKYIRTFINSVAEASPGDLPNGSIIVKENFSKQDESTLTALTVMQRIKDFDPENGDWFWARYSPSGELTHSGSVSMCINCHTNAGGDDLVFLNDE